ncbi:HNH endonuclease [Enterococcus saccharolyticus]|uniref:HNH endonuclease n=1 Tax=Enterococcus saccharolyticus TaxID=41997 RepID=UPI0039E192D7
MKRRCEYGGCRELVDIGNRYCTAHKAQTAKEYNKNIRENNVKQQNGKTNKDIADFYKSKEWRKVRLAVLSRDNYICIPCLKKGYIHEGNLVHHKIELRDVGGWEHRLDMDNLETINRGCHNATKHYHSQKTKEIKK